MSVATRAQPGPLQREGAGAGTEADRAEAEEAAEEGAASLTEEEGGEGGKRASEDVAEENEETEKTATPPFLPPFFFFAMLRSLGWEFFLPPCKQLVCAQAQ